MDAIIEFFQSNWQEIIRAVYDIGMAIGGLILVMKRTGTKRINRKIDEHVIRDNINYDLSNYDAFVNGKHVKLEDIKVKKRSK